MSKTYKKWTVEEELVISRMRKEGSTIKTIAEFLNRSESSVNFKIHTMINSCKIEPIARKPRVIKVSKPKIDYDEVAKRIENGGLRNIQQTLREYARETGVSIHALHRAYYNESQSKTRIKDRVRAYTIVTPRGVIKGANKNSNAPIIKCSIWQKIKTWLYSSVLS